MQPLNSDRSPSNSSVNSCSYTTTYSFSLSILTLLCRLFPCKTYLSVGGYRIETLAFNGIIKSKNHHRTISKYQLYQLKISITFFFHLLNESNKSTLPMSVFKVHFPLIIAYPFQQIIHTEWKDLRQQKHYLHYNYFQIKIYLFID